MTRKLQTRMQPAGDTVPQSDAVQLDSSVFSQKFEALLDSATQPTLAVTYWFDPVPHPEPYAVTVRFSGRRVGVKGRHSAGDRFVHDETIDKVVPGSGPISLTARITNIHPGEWTVTAQVLGAMHAAHKSEKQARAMTVMPVSEPASPVARFWRRWASSAESEQQMKTCPAPFVRVPGIFPGIWGGMVAIGMLVALILQFVVIAREHLVLGPWWVVSLGAIAVGIVGAKMWFIVLHRREHKMDGWCIQGFITGAVLTTALLLVVLHVPAGAFLDMTAPGLLVAMAIGRVGCFFAGCCGGPPTASRWGVWSSDQRVGVRRIPTQLMELALALSLGLVALGAVLVHGPARGAFFVGGLAAYTLVRQGILHLRAERRKTKWGGLITAVLATLVLVVAVVLFV